MVLVVGIYHFEMLAGHVEDFLLAPRGFFWTKPNALVVDRGRQEPPMNITLGENALYNWCMADSDLDRI